MAAALKPAGAIALVTGSALGLAYLAYNILQPKAKVLFPSGSYLDRLERRIQSLQAQFAKSQNPEEQALLKERIQKLSQRRSEKAASLVRGKESPAGSALGSALGLPRAPSGTLTREQFLEFTTEFTKAYHEAIQNARLQEKKIRRMIAARSEPVNEDELQAVIAQNLEGELRRREAALYSRMNTTAQECREALEKYKADPEVAQAVNALRQTGTADVDADGPPSGIPSPSSVVTAYESFMVAAGKAAEEAVNELKPKGLGGIALQQAVAERVQVKIQDGVHNGIKWAELQAALDYYIATDLEFQMKIQQISAEHQMKTRALFN